MVHRDLKPRNILVSSDGVVKLLDFGLPSCCGPRSTAGATLTGLGGLQAFTPEYASPEQLRGEPISTSTDVYALGVLLFELLADAGRITRGTDRFPSIERAVLEQDPDRPSVAIMRPPERGGPELDGRASGDRRPSQGFAGSSGVTWTTSC